MSTSSDEHNDSISDLSKGGDFRKILQKAARERKENDDKKGAWHSSRKFLHKTLRRTSKDVTVVSKSIIKPVRNFTEDVCDVTKAIAKPVGGVAKSIAKDVGDVSRAIAKPVGDVSMAIVKDVGDVSKAIVKPMTDLVVKKEKDPLNPKSSNNSKDSQASTSSSLNGLPPVSETARRQSTRGSVEVIPEVYTDGGSRRRTNLNARALTLGLEQASADYLDMVEKIRVQEWLGSFRRLDPRYCILKFFDDVATLGTTELARSGVCSMDSNNVPVALRVFKRSAVFSVWRPTSKESIKKMILGHGTGKGLDVKGKSAKVGKLSAFVPFVQIHEESHKKKVRTLPKDGIIRVFYQKKASRDQAKERLEIIKEDMLAAVSKARKFLRKEQNAKNSNFILNREDSVNAKDDGVIDKLASAITDTALCGQHDESPEDDFLTEEEALKTMCWDFEHKEVTVIDDYAPKCYGLMVSKRLFWEAYVMRHDISRLPGSQFDTGRPSMPAFQDMNFKAIKSYVPDNSLVYNDKPVAVVWQFTDPYNDPNEPDPDPMCPQTLLMAYEERGRVLPVVSDFDCFLIGTRAIKYGAPLPKSQIDLVKWNLDEIQKILDTPKSSESWASRWLTALKDEKAQPHKVTMPAYGYGDPVSYSMMKHAVGRLNVTGAVRHGAECFNYYFPQDLDDEFLIVSDIFLDDKYKSEKYANVPWRYVNVDELKEFLYQQIDEGFTFPLNPKWVLCDQGWKKVYDHLLKSNKPNVQSSLDAWYPPDSGIRERIEEISAKHPNGLQILQQFEQTKKSGTQVMDLAELELQRYLALTRAKRKLRAIMFWIALGQKAKRRREQMEQACLCAKKDS